MSLASDEVQEFRATARRFARREVTPLVGTEGRDGRLTRLPDVLSTAAHAGLVASPDQAAPGHDYGVWGRAARKTGAAASLAVLEELATACAGVATAVHAAGLGACAAGETSVGGDRLAWAWPDRSWRLTGEALTAPPATALRLQDGRLQGRVSFVHQAPGTDGYVLLAAANGGWARVHLPVDATGLRVTPAGPRTGLAAVEVVHLECAAAPLPPAAHLGEAAPDRLLAVWALGLAAVAVGTLRGALQAATAYAGERHQGGALIEHHPAVRDLLAGGAARLHLATAALQDAGATSTPNLPTALALKRRLTEDARVGVSDALQVLGGYGYMEEYRLEKRLRDALTLESLWPDPAACDRLLAHDLLGRPA